MDVMANQQDRIGVLEELLNERYSVRAFLPREVPRETIEHVLKVAQRTASWCNSQPWQVLIASGEASGKLGTMLERAAALKTQLLERRLAVFLTVLEPAMILVMGGLMQALGWTAVTDILLRPSTVPPAEQAMAWGRLLGDSLALLWTGTLTVAVLEIGRAHV